MPAYVIVSYDIVDRRAFEPYVPGVMPLLRKHGGEVLVGDFQADALEGRAAGVNVVLRFDSEEAVRNWYNDPEYQPVKQIRLNSTKNTVAVLAKAFVMPPT